jgi:hypothetical protein
MRQLLVAAATAVLGLTGVGSAAAQFYPRPTPPPNYGVGFRPGLSPYLNITRGGSDPATNYFLQTLPEFQRRYNAQVFQEDITDLYARERLADERLPVIRRPVPSGTYSLVNNTGGYFNNTYNYFGTGARIQAPIIRPGTYSPPPRTPGAPPRGSLNPGFPPNSTCGGPR